MKLAIRPTDRTTFIDGEWAPITQLLEVENRADWGPSEGHAAIDFDAYQFPEGPDYTTFLYNPLRGVFKAPDGTIWREPVPELPPAPVPSITPLQLRLWLLINKSLDDGGVTALIAGSPLSATDKSIALIAWQYALIFERAHPFVEVIAGLLGMTPTETDQAFREASTLL